MEQVKSAKDKLKGAGKWLGLLVLTIILGRFLEPALDWSFNLIVDIFSGISSSYTDGVYRATANVYSEIMPRVNTLFVLIALLFLLSLSSNSTNRQSGRSVVSKLIIYSTTVILIVTFPIIIRDIEAHKIRSVTLSQIDIIKSYTPEAEQLYSQFLLVQTEQDFIELWTSVMSIATKEQVVLPAFEKLISVDEDLK